MVINKISIADQSEPRLTMTLRRCTRHELCSTSTEQTGITRSANWAEWKVAGGRLDRGIEESQECDVCWQDKSVDSWSHVTQWKPFAALLLLTQGKSYLHVQKEHGFTPTWLKIQNFGRESYPVLTSTPLSEHTAIWQHPKNLFKMGALPF